MSNKALTILVSCQTDEGIVGPILQGFQSWISERTQWTVLNPVVGNLPANWLEDPARHLAQVDFVLLLGFGNDQLHDYLCTHFQGRVLTTFRGAGFENVFWSVGPDQEAIGELAGRWFWQSGLKHAAVGLYADDFEWQDQRLRAFAKALEPHGISIDSYRLSFQPRFEINPRGDLLNPVSERLAKRDELTAWIQNLPPETGVFCSNDDVARSFLSVAIESGRAIPEDLSFLGVDNHEHLCESVFPSLSSIDMGWQAIGRRMAQIIEEYSLPRKSRPRAVQVDSLRVVHRGSTLVGDARQTTLRRAMHYLREHLEKNPSLDSTARALGLYGHTLGKLFQDLRGKAFVEERKALQIERAKELLLAGDLSIEDISLRCGFAEASPFYRFFKRFTGQTPGEYMEAHSKKTLNKTVSSSKSPVSPCRPWVLVDSPQETGVAHLILRGLLPELGHKWEGVMVSPHWGNFPPDWLRKADQVLRGVDMVLLFNETSREALEAYDRYFDGIIVSATDLPELKGRAVVFSPDNYAVGRFAAESLYPSGKQQYAYCGYHASVVWSVARGKGFADRVRDWKAPFFEYRDRSRRDVRMTTEGNYILPLGEQEKQLRHIVRWLKKIPPQTAIFAANDRRARQVLVAAQSLGRNVPADLEILGADNISVFCESMRPQISSLDLGWESIGKEIGTLISGYSAGLAWPPQGQKDGQDFVLVERGSAGLLTQRKTVVAQAMSYLRDHLRANPTRETVAAAVGVSDRTLARYFEEVMGNSFLEEKQRLKGQTARAKLREGCAVDEIAALIGYREVTAFRRWFKQHTGQTTKQFQKTMRSS